MLPVLSFPNIVQVAELEILDLVKGMTYLFHKQSLKKLFLNLNKVSSLWDIRIFVEDAKIPLQVT